MKKSVKVILGTAVIALSIFSAASLSFADSVLDRYYFRDTHQTITYAKLKEMIPSSFANQLGGVYIDDNGNSVILLTEKNPEFEEKIKGENKYSNKTVFYYVKYSEQQLLDAQDRLYGVASDLGIQFTVTNIKQNKVIIYISKEAYHQNKQEIFKHIDEDMVQLVFGNFKMINQA
ncbi:hypothetical protein [Paenibacillus abyssi]|uniref:Uncharacterized protein n=1 Tax=Paenibacillus abyssi TaxID=1340531 RepID=A0A917LHT1_9BACL|nr:hypothetical protein [Paenibacillus abyssi]GGG26004.1 hypothetical protein GCM10010916_47980 [Paenibacillus abyssi]